MKYLMLVCVDPTVQVEPDERGDVEPWVAEMDGRGVRLMGNRLCDQSDATTVRIRDGQVLVSDGPYAETKEQIAGFDLLECADLDEALEVAGKHPVAKWGAIDVRPFWVD